MNTLDAVLLLFIGVSAVIGLRGLIKEVMSLALLVVALFISLAWVNDFAPLLDAWINNMLLQQAAAGLGLFVALMLAGHLLIKLTVKVLHTIGLGGVDRLLGFGFGTLRGLLLLVVINTYAGGWLSNTVPALNEQRSASVIMPVVNSLSEWLQENFNLKGIPMSDEILEYLP